VCTWLASFEKDYTGMHGQHNIKIWRSRPLCHDT